MNMGVWYGWVEVVGAMGIYPYEDSDIECTHACVSLYEISFVRFYESDGSFDFWGPLVLAGQWRVKGSHELAHALHGTLDFHHDMLFRMVFRALDDSRAAKQVPRSRSAATRN